MLRSRLLIRSTNISRWISFQRYYSEQIIDADYVSGSEEDAENVEQSLTIAERVKSLVHLRISGTLSSLAIRMKSSGDTEGDVDDVPPEDSPPLWASVMPYIIHNSNPVFGVFPKERHSANLLLHEKASLVVC